MAGWLAGWEGGCLDPPSAACTWAAGDEIGSKAEHTQPSPLRWKTLHHGSLAPPPLSRRPAIPPMADKSSTDAAVRRLAAQPFASSWTSHGTGLGRGGRSLHGERFFLPVGPLAQSPEAKKRTHNHKIPKRYFILAICWAFALNKWFPAGISQKIDEIQAEMTAKCIGKHIK